MEVGNPAQKQLVRDAKREALLRMEEAARTVAEFEEVVLQWDKLDVNRESRKQDHEIGRPDAEMLHWTEGLEGKIRNELDKVIPAPFDGHAWWRQLLIGDFFDTIHDCAYEMHKMTNSRPLFDFLQRLNGNQLEVLYLRAIRQESNQQIAKRRGQSDRNIRKVYDTLIVGLRRRMFERLVPRFDDGLPLTFAQRRFVQEYRTGRFQTKKPAPKKANQRAALDDKDG